MASRSSDSAAPRRHLFHLCGSLAQPWHTLCTFLPTQEPRRSGFMIVAFSLGPCNVCLAIFLVIVLLADLLHVSGSTLPLRKTLTDSRSSSNTALAETEYSSRSEASKRRRAAVVAAAGEAAESAAQQVAVSTRSRAETMTTSSSTQITTVYSDVDGTLVHYDYDEQSKAGAVASALAGCDIVGAAKALLGPSSPEEPDEMIYLPASSTGRKARISRETLRLVQKIRQRGTTFVLISGMRGSTFEGRKACLPAADAYVIENGGRIFYPKTRPSPQDEDIFTAADVGELEEDLEWRKELASGSGGPDQDEKEAGDRQGPLWDVCRSIQKDGGPGGECKVDTNSYYTMIRVNVGDDPDLKKTEQLLEGLDPALASNTNFGLVDIFPKQSGKDQCVLYLSKRFGVSMDTCAALCDDDNDVKMASLCGCGAFLTGITSQSMQKAVDDDPDHFRVPEAEHGTGSAEESLRAILSRCAPEAGSA